MAPDESATSTGGMSVLHKAIAGFFVTVLAPVLVAFGIKFSDTVLTAKPEADKSAATAPASGTAPATNVPPATVPGTAAAPAASAPPPAVAPVSVTASASTAPAAGLPSSASSGSSSAAPGAAAGEKEDLHFPHFKKPTTPVVRLFNGRDLTGFYTYLGRLNLKGKPLGKDNDPARVFSVNGGQLFVSGEVLGTLETEKEFEDYWLTLEYKWGERTWAPRAEEARHSAVLINIDGPDGAVRNLFPASIHCQIVEGMTGEFLLAAGTGEHNLSLTVATEQREMGHGAKRHAAPYYKPGQPFTTFTEGFIKRYPPVVGWEDVKGIHPPGDVEHAHGEWNTLEIVSFDGKILVQLNGQVVNFAMQATPSKGRIGIQSNGAEIIFRAINLQQFRRGKKSQEKQSSVHRSARTAPAGLESRSRRGE